MEDIDNDDYGDDEATTELIHHTFGDEYFYRIAALLANPAPEATAEIQRIFNQTKELYIKNNWIGIPKPPRSGKQSATGKQSELAELGEAAGASSSPEGRPISAAKVIKGSPKRESSDSSLRDGSSSAKRDAGGNAQRGKQESRKHPAEPMIGLELSDNDESVPPAKKPATTIIPAPITKFEELLNLSTSVAEGSGASCALCKESSSSANNVLVECQECHSHYHQRCHEPPIANSQINDPRVVWYCEKCSNKLKNLAANKSTNSALGAQNQPKTAKPMGPKKDPVASLAFKKAVEARTVTTGAGAGPTASSAVDKKAEISTKFADFLAKQKASKKLSSPTSVPPSAAMPPVFQAASSKGPIASAHGLGKLAPGSAIVKTPSTGGSGGSGGAFAQQPFTTKPLPSGVPKPTPVGGSSGAASATPMESAEKRLMQMKRKAAQKQADRGAH